MKSSAIWAAIVLAGGFVTSCGARAEVSLEPAPTACTTAPLRDRPLDVVDVRATTVHVTLALDGRPWTRVQGARLMFRRQDGDARADVSVDRDMSDAFAVYLPIGTYDVELAIRGECRSAPAGAPCVGGVIARDVVVGPERRTLALDVRPAMYNVRFTVNGQAPTIADSVLSRSPDESVLLQCGALRSSVVLDAAGRASFFALPNSQCSVFGRLTGECSLTPESAQYCRNRIADRVAFDPLRRDFVVDIATRPMSVRVSILGRAAPLCRTKIEIERDGEEYRHNHQTIEHNVDQDFSLVAGTYDVRAVVSCQTDRGNSGSTITVPLARSLRVDGGREPLRLERALSLVLVDPWFRFESEGASVAGATVRRRAFAYADGTTVETAPTTPVWAPPGIASITASASRENGAFALATFESVTLRDGAAPSATKRVFPARVRVCSRGVCEVVGAGSGHSSGLRVGHPQGPTLDQLFTDERAVALFATHEPTTIAPRFAGGTFASPLPLGVVSLREDQPPTVTVERHAIEGRLLHNGAPLTESDCSGLNFVVRQGTPISDIRPTGDGAFSIALFESGTDELWAHVCPCHSALLRACGSVRVRGCAR